MDLTLMTLGCILGGKVHTRGSILGPQLIFGQETLENHLDIMPILRVGLASHLIHRDSYDGLLKEGHPESGKLLPDDSPLRSTPLFTNPIMNQLKKWVHIAMPWEDNYEKYFHKTTGIPPHVVLMAYIKGLQADMRGVVQAVQNVPSEVERLLERRQMAGPLSLESIVNAVENGAVMTGMAANVSTLMQLLLTEGGQLRIDGSRNISGQRHAHNMRLVSQYRHADGEYRRVPHTWKFPSLPLQNMYIYWHCGDEEGNIPPMKMFETRDVKFLQRGSKKLRNSLCDEVSGYSGYICRIGTKTTHVSHGGKCLLQEQPACTLSSNTK